MMTDPWVTAKTYTDANRRSDDRDRDYVIDYARRWMDTRVIPLLRDPTNKAWRKHGDVMTIRVAPMGMMPEHARFQTEFELEVVKQLRLRDAPFTASFSDLQMKAKLSHQGSITFSSRPEQTVQPAIRDE